PRCKLRLGRRCLVVVLTVILIPLQNAESKPSPINTMPLDQAFIVQFHGFDEIYLIAFWTRARVLPDEPLAIGQVSCSEILTHRRLPYSLSFKQRAHLAVTS